MLIRIFFAYFLTIFASIAAVAQEIPPGEGWHEIPNTRLRTVCAADGEFPEVHGVEGCPSITSAWNGGIFDSARNRLIIWGGGHDAYYGNELYAFDLDTLTIERITDPGLPIASSCTESIANGTQPNSRHTYDGIEYIEHADAMFVFGGSLACGSGNFGSDTWTFDFQQGRWQRMNPSGPIPRGDAGIMTAYDPVSKLVYLHDRLHLYSYNIEQDLYTRLSSEQVSLGYHMVATIDPLRRIFLIAGFDSTRGSGRVYSYDIGQGSSYVMRTESTSGGGPIINAIYPGLAFDDNSGHIIAWSENSGGSIYALDPNSNSWIQNSFANGPTPVGNGTHGRWQYSSAYGVFVLANRVDDNIFVMRPSDSIGQVVRPKPPLSFSAQ